MPYALTDRQREYLEFIRSFIKLNESSPRLEEIADHFGVKAPTAHKALKAIQKKGYLLFHRSKESGFFIRLVERAGTSVVVTEIVIAGKIDKHGEVFDFPKMHGHFASVLSGANPKNLFGLVAMEDIPEGKILLGDLLIMDYSKKPQPNDICLFPIGKRWFLVNVVSKTFDEELHSEVIAMDYPIPEAQSNQDVVQWLNWIPLAYTPDDSAYFEDVVKEQNWTYGAIPPDLAVATALRLSRQLTF